MVEPPEVSGYGVPEECQVALSLVCERRMTILGTPAL